MIVPTLTFYVLCCLLRIWTPVEGFIPGIEDYDCKEANGQPGNISDEDGFIILIDFPPSISPSEPMDEESFEITPSVTQVGSKWNLVYDIDWEPAVTDHDVIYVMNTTYETRETKLEDWNYTDCRGALLRVFAGHESVEIRDSPHFKAASVPFTHRALFQVGYGITSLGSPWPISPAVNLYFETPDCYAATGDAEFCSTQPVMTCGEPRDLTLRECIVVDGAITTLFEWQPPVQINAMAEVVVYVVALNSTDGEGLETDTVAARENNDMVSWAVVSKNGSRSIELNETYILIVTPYVEYMNDSAPPVPGRRSMYTFVAELTPGVTTPSYETTTSKNGSEGGEDGTEESLSGDTEASSANKIIVPVLIVSLTAVVLIALLCILSLRRKRRRWRNWGSGSFRYLEGVRFSKKSEKKRFLDPLLKSKEIGHDQVTLERKIGEGAFGVVHKGVATGIEGRGDVIVAVKTTKVGAFQEFKEDLLSEMRLVADLGEHTNILSLVACCSISEPFYLITEFMQYGDLLGFLRKCRLKNSENTDPIYNIDETKQLVIARDIAMGMAHIQERRFYHGDLAARNILVGDKMSIKVSDFGLAEDVYTRGYKRRAAEQKIPIKWCSLETILNGVCSSQGDVWSFAVLLYEIFTLGGTPYPGMAPRFLVSMLKQGYRMEKPNSCPEDVYNLMGSCWVDEAEDRPSFLEIAEELAGMLTARTDYLQHENANDENEGGDEAEHTEDQGVRYVTSPVDLAPINDDNNDIDLDQLQDALKFQHDADDGALML